MTGLLTLITAVRDGMPFLAEMIASVREGQPALPHIVVDDGSRDATPDTLASFGDTLDVVRLPESGGPAAAMNIALARVKTPWFLLVDADDLLQPGYIAQVLSVLESEPTPDLVYGQWREFGDAAAKSRWAVREEQQIGYITSGTVMRTALASRLGGFNPAIRFGYFIDLRMRAISAGASELVLPDLATMRRVHGGNMTIQEPERMRDFLTIARSAAARARSRT
jgi:glycosyltransferase involved in cell wall biosynthesis